MSLDKLTIQTLRFRQQTRVCIQQFSLINAGVLSSPAKFVYQPLTALFHVAHLDYYLIITAFELPDDCGLLGCRLRTFTDDFHRRLPGASCR